jgi:hypothetical protein
MTTENKTSQTTEPAIAVEPVLAPVFDYLGNEVKEGMTIKIIRTKPIYGDIQILKPKKNKKGFFKPKIIYKQPKECWETIGEYEVVKDIETGVLRYIVDYEESGQIHFFLSNILWGFQKADILTIKGISDVSQ